MTALYLITLSGLSLAQPELEQITLLEQKTETNGNKKESSSKKKASKVPINGIYFEGGGLQTFDSITDDLIGYQLDMAGVRFTRDLNANVSLLASWNLGGIRSDSNTYYDYGYYDYEYEDEYYYHESDVGTVATFNQLMTGVRYSYRLTSWLHPYASAQALLQHGHLLITDDYDSERPLYEFRSNAFGVGGVGVLGLEMRTKKIAKKYKISTYFEGGYAAITPLQFNYTSGVEEAQKNSLGQLRFGSAYSRIGIGLKF